MFKKSVVALPLTITAKFAHSIFVACVNSLYIDSTLPRIQLMRQTLKILSRESLFVFLLERMHLSRSGRGIETTPRISC